MANPLSRSDSSARAPSSDSDIPHPHAPGSRPGLAALGTLIALGLVAALPAASKAPSPSERDAASTPQHVLAETPFPSARQFATNALEQLAAEHSSVQSDLFAGRNTRHPYSLGFPSRAFSLVHDAGGTSPAIGTTAGTTAGTATSTAAKADAGLRAGSVHGTLAQTLDRIDMPPEVRIQIGDLVAHELRMNRRARPGDTYRLAFDTHDGQAHLSALQLDVRGHAFGALWFKAPGATRGAYYTFDGTPLEAAAFTTPVDYSRVSSYFGERIHPVLHARLLHTGVDLVAPTGTRVNAAADGVVAFVGTDPGGYGRYVVIDHPDGYSTYYAHLSAFARGLRTGEQVRQGERIGSVGETGMATGPHLHFEVRIDDKPVDPLATLAQARNTLSPMQLGVLRHEVKMLRAEFASAAPRHGVFARIDAPLWADFASDTSTLRGIFNAYYRAS